MPKTSEIVVESRLLSLKLYRNHLSVTFQAKLIEGGDSAAKLNRPRAKVAVSEKRCSRLGREQRFRSVDRRMLLRDMT